MPHRIEHLQLCPPEWWDRAAAAGIVASMQPVHVRSDVHAAERHWGHARCRGAYAFAPLWEAGTVLAFGSDAPVETPDPRQGLYAAVARTAWDDGPADGWFPEHRLTAEQALRAYTEGPAWAAGESNRRGRLLPGYDADLAVWNRDPLACTASELLDLCCELTMVGGEVVYEQP
jgi:predicted amidohydrolase YtcJ